MSNRNQLANSTPDSIRASGANQAYLIGDAFSDSVIMQSENADLLGMWEGTGPGNVVTLNPALGGGKGQTVHINVMGSLGGSGRRGSDVLEGYEETPPASTYAVEIDELTHAVAWQEAFRLQAVAGGSLTNAYITLLGNWFGKKKQNDALMSLRKSAIGANTLLPNGHTVSTLVTTDVLSTTLIDDSVGLMSSRGGQPLTITTGEKGAQIESFLILAAQSAANSLNSNTLYQNAALHAQERGQSNTIFRGGYVPWRGNTVFQWNVKDEITYGPVGCPLTPKARLGDAWASGATISATESTILNAIPTTVGDVQLTIYGSGVLQSVLAAMDTDMSSYYEPFQWFDGYDYKFTKRQAAAPDSGTYYFMIYDPADQKWCICSYVGTNNNGNRIIITKRLSATAGGTYRDTTVGSVVYNSSRNKEAFPVGAWILPCNAFGYLTCDTLALGETALVRAYGSVPMKKLEQATDYSRKQGRGICSYFGQAAAIDPIWRQPRNYVRIRHIYNPPGINPQFA